MLLTRVLSSYRARNCVFTNPKRFYSRANILGIETSCDDTGCAIINSDGQILGEALHSQLITHLNNGGIIPPIAQTLHRENIERVVENAMQNSGLDFRDVTAIATTVKPGLPMSLIIGLKYGKYLCKRFGKPFIPIHHMEAHALTARLFDPSLSFPFLVLLISGGHCLLALAQDIDKFLLLGTTLDDSPGEAFDKAARRMKLRNLQQYANVSGGQAIEMAALQATNPFQFEFNIPMLQRKDCTFSISGIKAQILRHLLAEESKHDVAPDGLIPDINNLCAGFQLIISRHLCHRVQRGMIFVQRRQLIGPKPTLVVSGGVACNNFIAKCLKMVCDELGFHFVRPPPKLCTDNGVMIAWNGVEKWKKQSGIYNDFDHIEIEKNSPLGVDVSEDVINECIRCKWVKISKVFDTVDNEQPLNKNVYSGY